MINWFKKLLGLKTQPTKLPTNYRWFWKSDMLFELDSLKFLLGQIRSAKQTFDGVDDNIILQLIYAEEHVQQAIEFLTAGIEECLDDADENGEYPVFMAWNKDKD